MGVCGPEIGLGYSQQRTERRSQSREFCGSLPPNAWGIAWEWEGRRRDPALLPILPLVTTFKPGGADGRFHASVDRAAGAALSAVNRCSSWTLSGIVTSSKVPFPV